MSNGNGNGNGTTLQRLCKIFDADWYAQRLDTKILYKPGETETGLGMMAKELLRLYFARPQEEIVGAEVPFTVPLVDPASGKELGMNLEGFIDLIAADDTIVEFKTSGQAMNPRDVDNHLQLTGYSYAYEILNHRPAKVLRIVDFVKTRKPKMIVLDTSRTARDRVKFFCLAKEVLHGIQSNVFSPRTGYWRRDCEYAPQCRAWRGN